MWDNQHKQGDTSLDKQEYTAGKGWHEKENQMSQ